MVIWTLAAIAWAGGLAIQEPQGLEAGLAQTEALIEEGEWDQARELLLGLIEAFEKDPELMVERPRLVRGLERTLFWKGRERPELEDLIEGKVVTYREREGWIELEYDSFRSEDFERSVGPIQFIHCLQFEGEIEVDWRGEELNGDPGIWLVLSDTELLQVTLVPRTRVEGGWLRKVSAFWYDGKRHNGSPLHKPKSRRIEDGKPWRLGFKVDETEFQGLWNRRKLFNYDLERPLAGALGFERVDFKELRIGGRIDRVWLRATLDSMIDDQWREFRAETDVEESLPRRLRTKSLRAYDKLLFLSDDLPGPELEGQKALMAKALEGDRDEADREDLFEELIASATEPTTEVFRHWLAGYLELRVGQYANALPHLDQVCELDPGFGVGRVARGLVRSRLEMRAEAIEDLRAALDEKRFKGWVYQTLANQQLLLGRHADVRETCLAAASERRYGQGLDEINALRIKADTGPLWAQAFERETEHYEITSNIDQRTCVDAAKVLEVAFERFSGAIRPITIEADSKFRVYLFDGEAGFQRYISELTGVRRENAAGLYFSSLRQLLIWNLPDREAMLRTVRHEGFHQYFSQLVADPPVWLNEGLAEYWEAADFTKSKSKMIPVRREYLPLFEDGPLWNIIRLDQLLAIDPPTFYEKAELTYGFAWGFVYFLLHSTRENRATFDQLIDRLAAGESGRDATRAVFGHRVKELDRELRAFMQGLDD